MFSRLSALKRVLFFKVLPHFCRHHKECKRTPLPGTCRQFSPSNFLSREATVHQLTLHVLQRTQTHCHLSRREMKEIHSHRLPQALLPSGDSWSFYHAPRTHTVKRWLT